MVIPIHLRGQVAAHFVVEDCDEWAASRRWHFSSGYPATGGKSQRFHSLVMKPPTGYEVDHIDGDKLNNRRSNLRVVTHAQNVQNMRTRRGLPRGVYGPTPSGRYFAQVKSSGIKHCLGHFDTPEEAAVAATKKRLALGFLV